MHNVPVHAAMRFDRFETFRNVSETQKIQIRFVARNIT